jgi:uncharacterized membrane protein
MIQQPFSVLAVLLAVLACLFAANRTPAGQKVFRWVPLLVFAYFLPTVLSNTGIIPITSPLYTAIKIWLLPASLVLLTLSVDIPAIMSLGRKAIIMFLTATTSIVVGGPLAYLTLGWLVPDALGEQTWKGLAALAGSWIGGGANFIAIGESVGATSSTISMMVVVDVAVASVWMAFLLGFAGRDKAMDDKIGADRTTVDAVRDTVADYQAEVARPTHLAALLTIGAIAFGATGLAHAASAHLPVLGNIVSQFTWVVILVTTAGVAMSFTPLRRLEGEGASSVGSVFLYLLVASIGAHAEFSKVLEVPGLVAVGALWMTFHAVLMMWMRRLIKAPIFFAAVGSQANIGGAASAPIVASAFHPALAPVGVLLSIGGYVLGTYAGLLCAFLLEQVHHLIT